MSIEKNAAPRLVPATRDAKDLAHEALDKLYRVRGLTAGASLLIGAAKLDPDDASLRVQIVALAKQATSHCRGCETKLDEGTVGNGPRPAMLSAAIKLIERAEGQLQASHVLIDSMESRDTHEGVLQALDLTTLALDGLGEAKKVLVYARSAPQREAA